MNMYNAVTLLFYIEAKIILQAKEISLHFVYKLQKHYLLISGYYESIELFTGLVKRRNIQWARTTMPTMH